MQSCVDISRRVFTDRHEQEENKSMIQGDRGRQAGNAAMAIDYCLVNDAHSHRSIDFLTDDDRLFDSKKVAVIIDHDTPSGSEAVSAIQRKLMRFAAKHATIFHQGEGVGYQLLLDRYVKPGQTVVGCGEHIGVFGAVGAIGLKVSPEELAGVLKSGVLSTTEPEWVEVRLCGRLLSPATAKDLILAIVGALGTEALAGKMIRFTGDGLPMLDRNDRITLCNLAGKTAARACVLADMTLPAQQPAVALHSFDLSTVKPMIAGPDSFEKIAAVTAKEAMKVNEVFVGGCSSGRIEDLRLAAAIVRGKKVARGVRLMIAPVTSDVYVQALQEGLVTDFIDAGAIVMNQGCSVCWGKSQGVLDAGEVLLSAGSCNHKGCAGSSEAKVYAVSAATAAASAICGELAAAGGESGGM